MYTLCVCVCVCVCVLDAWVLKTIGFVNVLKDTPATVSPKVVLWELPGLKNPPLIICKPNSANFHYYYYYYYYYCYYYTTYHYHHIFNIRPSAHDVQMECSNMGRCDRSTGQCHCASGYEGAACERSQCTGQSLTFWDCRF